MLTAQLHLVLFFQIISMIRLLIWLSFSVFYVHKFMILFDLWILQDNKSIISTCSRAQYFQRSLKRRAWPSPGRWRAFVSVLQIPVDCLLFIYSLWYFFCARHLQILVWFGQRSSLIELVEGFETRCLVIRTFRVALTYFLQFLHPAVPSFEEIRCSDLAYLLQLDAQLWCTRPLTPFLPGRDAFLLLAFFQTSREYLPGEQRTPLTRQGLLSLRCRARRSFLFAREQHRSWSVICLYDIHWTIGLLFCVTLVWISWSLILLFWRSSRFLLLNRSFGAPQLATESLDVLWLFGIVLSRIFFGFGGRWSTCYICEWIMFLVYSLHACGPFMGLSVLLRLSTLFCRRGCGQMPDAFADCQSFPRYLFWICYINLVLQIIIEAVNILGKIHLGLHIAAHGFVMVCPCFLLTLFGIFYHFVQFWNMRFSTLIKILLS